LVGLSKKQGGKGAPSKKNQPRKRN
jgi:hypothetical protein